MNDVAVELIEASDLDGLIRHVDGLVAARDWAALDRLVRRATEAVERGKQVWGIIHYVRYRTALEGPPERAAAAVEADPGRLGLGPLWEVAASTHSWEELAPHLADRRARAFVAHERALRGEGVVLEPDEARVLEIPAAPAPWEPKYPPVTYRSDKVEAPTPEATPLEWMELPEAGAVRSDDAAVDALEGLVEVWREQSSGTIEARATHGDALAAIRALGPRRARVARVSPQEAMAHMVWAASSGGAHGRRRGTAVGRRLTWLALAALLGIEEDWPVTPDEIGAHLEELEFWRWDPGDAVGGWGFHLAVADPDAGLAWVISAADSV